MKQLELNLIFDVPPAKKYCWWKELLMLPIYIISPTYGLSPQEMEEMSIKVGYDN